MLLETHKSEALLDHDGERNLFFVRGVDKNAREISQGPVLNISTTLEQRLRTGITESNNAEFLLRLLAVTENSFSISVSAKSSSGTVAQVKD